MVKCSKNYFVSICYRSAQDLLIKMRIPWRILQLKICKRCCYKLLKRKSLICASIIIIILIIMVQDNMLRYMSPQEKKFIKSYDVPASASHITDVFNLKKVVLWSKFFGWNWSEGCIKSCPINQCNITYDRTDLKNSDAIWFHARNLHESQDLPLDHPEHQRWILSNWEPLYMTFLDFRKYNGMFNWTVTYRSDSDIVIPYGHYMLRKKSTGTTQTLDILDIKTKSKQIAWIASNCDQAVNYRYLYAKELQKHIKVDVYGKCGTLKCPFGSQECEQIQKQYKFYLAFENGNCKDYVTEKLWTALRRGQVPIVMGGADYSSIAPPGSYINIEDFQSPKDLALFILDLTKDEDKFMQYHKWRKEYEIIRTRECIWCKVCEALHDYKKPAQVYMDLYGWFHTDTPQCLLSLWSKSLLPFKHRVKEVLGLWK